MRLRPLVPLLILFVSASCARKTEPASAKPPSAPLSAASASPASATPAPEAPAAATPAPLAYGARLGKVTFTHYCQTCHGETGAGDGFNAFNLDPHPRDLSDLDFQKKKSDADLADAIRRGGAGVGLSALMPPWGRTLSARQVDEVVLYLRTLPALRKPAS